VADTAAGNPPGDDGGAIDGAVLIRTGRRAPRRASGFTRVAIEDGAETEANGASTNGHDHTEVAGHGVALEVDALAKPVAPVDTTLLRDRLVRLHDLAGQELERRRAGAELEPVSVAPVPVERLSSFSREVPRLARGAPHAAVEALSAARIEELRHLLRSVSSFMTRQMELSGRHSRGETEADEFGFDVEWTDSLLPLFRFLYEHYWRVRVTGLENVPGEGRALLVSNHAGVLPFDGAMIRTAIITDHPQPRHARALIMDAFFGVPFISWFLRRTGNTLAHPGDAERLLQRDELVLVFPEGVKGTGKPYSERYRLRRFGRGGFAQIALRTGAPIIPVSVVGSEELYPMLANVGPLARLIGMPYFPITPTFPLLGPLGVLPLPSSWMIEFHEPIPLDEYDADAADDPGVVMRISDQVRDVIQDGLYRNLERRGSVFG
jgi:1-acyl-sn-glycerol-3-phosphate acyltransferase